jgi:hypothetical protein
MDIETVSCSIGILNILAALVSYYFNKSIGWGILHYFFGGLYLFYCLLKGRFSNGGVGRIFNHYI